MTRPRNRLMARNTNAIFLSYASQDAGAARRIFDALSSAGLEVWFDQSELRGGDAWDQKIRRQIKECALFMPIISEHTQTRAEGYFRLEWHLAEQRSFLMSHDQAFLLPVVVDDTPDSAPRVPERFRERQWTRLPGGATPRDFVERVRGLVSGTPDAQRERVPAGAQPREAPATGNEKSVAVLAFANLSGDKENEYFSDGISEELLTVLQKLPGLRVAARTSAFFFKGKNVTAQEIGSQLGVAHLVEGSVQKSANRVKINARLSRVSTGEETWSRSYTREMNDVFALQEELAAAIAGELRGHFHGAMSTASAVHAASKGGTTHPEAYQQYLMGRHQTNQFSSASEQRALRNFERATEIDPSFAMAWASLSQSHSWFCGYEGSLNREQFDGHLAKARHAADRALALEPDLPSGLTAQFWIQFGFDFDFAGGAAVARRALELAPSDPEVLVMSSRLAMAQSQTGLALEMARRAVAVDPISARTRVQLTLACVNCRLFEEARAEAQRVAELNPNSIFARSGTALIDFFEGKYAEVESSLSGAEREWHILWLLAMASFALGKRADSDRALGELIERNADTSAVQIAMVHAFRGESDEAFRWLDRARAQRDPGLVTLVGNKMFSKIKGDPRWDVFWRSFGLDAPRDA
jgi:TolB-like protein/tetratricopeptide (TPR) repeat protein